MTAIAMNYRCELPAGWKRVPLKHNLRRLSDKKRNGGEPMALENIESWTGRAVQTNSTFDGDGVAFKKDDILFGKLRPYLAKVHLAEKHGEAVGDLWVLRPQAHIAPRFASYQLLDSGFIDLVNGSTTGAKMPRAEWGFVGSIPVPTPPLAEQTAIAQFLDCETSRIDGLIEKKARFIALLKEKRDASITYAITKGIDADVPMKDSGIDWIGEVPEAWKVTKLGYLGRSANGINIGGDAFGTGHPFISYGDVYKNRQLPEKIEGLVQSSRQDQISYSVKAGDVLFTRTSETVDEVAFSSVAMSTVERAVFAGFLIRFRPYKNSLDPLFSKYAFQNSGLRDFFAREMKIVTRASLSQGLLHSMPIAVPPLEEQQRIGDYLEQMNIKFERLVERTERSIELLTEKRLALITAAVTGKIDVRTAA